MPLLYSSPLQLTVFALYLFTHQLRFLEFDTIRICTYQVCLSSLHLAIQRLFSYCIVRCFRWRMRSSLLRDSDRAEAPSTTPERRFSRAELSCAVSLRGNLYIRTVGSRPHRWSTDRPSRVTGHCRRTDSTIGSSLFLRFAFDSMLPPGLVCCFTEVWQSTAVAVQ